MSNPNPTTPIADTAPDHHARHLCLRMMVDAVNQTAAEHLAATLASTLCLGTTSDVESIERYPKFDACYEITLELPGGAATDVLAISPEGWTDADFAGDGSAVWNREEGRYFLLTQVRWAELYWRQ
ncbi:MAG: hypothetical protein R3F04_16140 [Lysobacteraceae bacterium]